MKTDITVFGLFKETGSGYRTHANFSSQIFAEIQIAFISKLTDINQDIISPLGIGKFQPDILQSTGKQFFHMSIMCLQPLIIVVTELQAYNRSFHQWCRSSHRQKIMYFFDSVNNFGRCHDIAQSPSCNGIRLGQRITDDCPLSHTRQCRNAGMYMRCIDNMLIHLIRNDINIIFDCKLCNDL